MIHVVIFTRKILKEWWIKAQRRRVLLSALDKGDRDYLYLTIKIFDELRSEAVGKIVMQILEKLKAALKSPFLRKVETVGIRRAISISEKAVKWGYLKADLWAQDIEFIKYLTVNISVPDIGYG